MSVLLIPSLLIFHCEDSSKHDKVDATQDSTAEYPAIIFLGDSLTAGYRLPLAQAFPAQIQNRLDEAGKQYRVVNAGRSGDTTAGGLERLSYYLRPSVNVKVLIIGLGSNDAMRGLDLKETEKNLRTIIKRTRAFDPEIKIMIFQMHTFRNMGAAYQKKYMDLFGKIARSEKIILLPFPLEKVALQAELNQDDGIHPNAEGVKIVAENVWQALKDKL